jgi:two-component system, OmpR family, heavy metal sensor histidine kinase CusS
VKPPVSIVGRLTLWYSASAFLLVLVSTAALYAALVSNLDAEDDEFITDTVNIVRASLREHPGDTSELRRMVEWEWTHRQYGQIFVRVLTTDGQTLVETPGMASTLSARAFPTPNAVDAFPPQGLDIGASGQSFRAVSALTSVGSDRRDTRLIQVALNQAREEDLLADYRKPMLLVLGLALLTCTAIGYAIAKRGVRPLAHITTAARRIRSNTLDSRIAVDGLPHELVTLAETFNAMLGRLEESFERLSRFSADIAHELRTPVNNLRGEAEVALRQVRPADEYRTVLESLLEEAVRLSRMIDSLLFVARAEHPETDISRERLHIAHEFAIVKEFYDAPASEAGVAIVIDADPGLDADLDRTLWQRAVSNLVANALDYTPRGGTITMRAQQSGSDVLVQVRDTGVGIPPNNLAHVFDRFYRADPARRGHAGRLGLGLALVKSIVTLHGGSVDVESDVGLGTTISLRVRARATDADFAAV